MFLAPRRGALDETLLLSLLVHQQSQWPHPSQRRPAPLSELGLVVRRAGRTARSLIGVLALLVLVMPNAAPKITLATSTYLCSGYAACEAVGYGHAGYRRASSTQYWRMYGGHNCTNYVAYRLIQTGMPDLRPWEGSGNATNWGVEMATITDQSPRVGAVAWYGANVAPAGSAGHVAYVEQVISKTEIIVSEDYWNGDFHWRRITKTGSGWPSGFIHFNDVAVEPTAPPTIIGSPTVGTPLEVATGAWTPTPTSVTYRWLADGVAIAGATTASYTPTPEVKGKTLTVEVTAQLDGYTSSETVLTTAPVAAGVLQPTELPTIQGNPEVGQPLTLSASSWLPQPSRSTTQWYADGVPLPGATGSSLVLNRDRIGKRISARVTASAKGYRKSTATAPETAPVLAKPIRITSPFVVKGRPQVARVLVARAGDLQPSNASVAYAWLRDGQRIAKATNRNYTVRRKDVGRSLAVQVTLTRHNYRPTTEIIAASSLVTTIPTVRVRPETTRGRVAVNIRVRAPGVPGPAGVITVRVGGRTVEGQLVRGVARLVVRDLKPGRRPVVVRYAGTDLVQPAVSRSSVQVSRHGQ